MNSEIRWKFQSLDNNLNEYRYVLRQDGMEPIASLYKSAINIDKSYFAYKATICGPTRKDDNPNFIRDYLFNKLGNKYEITVEAIYRERGSIYYRTGEVSIVNITLLISPDESTMTQDFANAIRTLALIYNEYIETCMTCGYEEAEELHLRSIDGVTYPTCEICEHLSDKEFLRGLGYEN